ncbi:MAG: sigma 54-interacting transcriptional regulator, partial [Deltaproteobacteria bacterium]|nr:sigma 54-interacting transcriptional regulator [Deltaproteobacteria bacterium]
LEAAAALIESDQFSSGYLRTMHTARGLARWLSAPELEARFEHARRTAAQVFLTRVPPERSELARKLPWLEADARPLPDGATLIDGPAVARLVRSLGEREDVLGLLTRVLDVLLEWTGAERGMLLLRRPSGALVPRAARRLSRGDLGGDQRAVSTTLAERALREGVPVVAVDAESELGDTHASIHALALRSVLVVPLVARGEPIGVVYLDDRIRRGAFGAREVAWAQTVAPIAAVAIADARKQRALDRALRRNERAQLALERELSQKEHVLEAARAELSRTMSRHIRRHAYDEIIGESPPIQRLLGLCDRISATEVPVLIQGESGTGKELVARAIHRNGSRSGGPFVSENCGALPETLLESALFGHVRGAFTGATRTHVGLLEAADRGTLFLDEIGEMSLSMQTKLLRVLEDGIVRPVGSERGRRVDLRLVAATHRDLDEMVAAGRFREDLLYRLDVLRMRVPPLRERREDIPLLVRHFLARYAGESRTVVSPAALERLVAFDWPGNVRQLENEVRRAIVLSDGVIDAEHLALGRTTVLRPTGDLTIRPRVDALEATLIEEAMRRTGGNQTRSAELLGMSRFGLRKLMKRLGIGA